jgi:Cdc6-like AAA superfamily ATPase
MSDSKVMRVNDNEKRIIEFLRENKSDTILNTELIELRSKSSNLKVKELLSILNYSKRLTDIKELISLGFLSDKDAKYLISCMNDNKNIVITGKIGSGKTTLANALLSACKEQEKIILLENNVELICNDKMRKIKSDNISLNKILDEALEKSPNRIVIDDLRFSSEIFGIAILLSNKNCCSLCTASTMSDFFSFAFSIVNNDIKRIIEELFREKEFIQVKLTVDYNHNKKIESIQTIKYNG